MKINLLHRYQSAATNEEPLQAGEHELDDSLAQYLVDNGHAVAIKETQYVMGVDVASGEDVTVIEKPKRTRRKKSQGG